MKEKDSPQISTWRYSETSTHRNPYIKEKGYKPTFTDEIFQIHRVDKRLPIVRYTIQDRDGEKIEGSFLKHELSRVMQ